MLYTIFMEFAGGTYAAQVRAGSPRSALKKWAKNIVPGNIYDLGPKGKEALNRQIHDKQIVPIHGMVNIWCATFLVGGKLALVNLIRMENAE